MDAGLLRIVFAIDAAGGTFPYYPVGGRFDDNDLSVVYLPIILKRMIQAEHITKSFGNLQVLKGIQLDVKAGEVVSIVGASGAGKTTLLQIVGTLSKQDGGTVAITACSLNHPHSHPQRWQSNIHNITFQMPRLYPNRSCLLRCRMAPAQ